MTQETLAASPSPLFAPFRWLAAIGEKFPDWLMPLLQRFAISGVFWLSARTKVDGFSIEDSTFFLFANDYNLPIIPSTWAAYAATIAEHLFPILLILGLFTRLSATALLIMTLTIQFLVYPGAWALHLTWIAILVPLIARGGGALSLDRLFKIP